MPDNKDWNPELYLKFKNERTQPSIDLVSRIDCDKPESIIDIGCGPGNSTQILAKRYPKASITGLDSSGAMIEKAKHDYPGQNWLIGDAGKLDLQKKYSIVFSNATIQWVPNHQKLVLELLNLAETDGMLAVQIPAYQTMPISHTVDEVAKSRKWKEKISEVKDVFIFHPAGFYYDVLASHTKSIDLWQTAYIHTMESHQAIIDMIKTTGMKPYLDKLESEADKLNFEQEVLSEIRKIYPSCKDGKVLFPFERLFFIARK